MYGGPAWTWDESRQQYYYHTYLPQQPDLNLRNEAVVEALKVVFQILLLFGALFKYYISNLVFTMFYLVVGSAEVLDGERSRWFPH